MRMQVDHRISRRKVVALGLVAALTPAFKSPHQDGGDQLMIPFSLQRWGAAFSPVGGVTTIDLTTMPYNHPLAFYRVTTGVALLDAGPLGVIAQTGTRAATVPDQSFQVTRTDQYSFYATGTLTAASVPAPRDVRLLIAGQSLGVLWDRSSALGALQARLIERGDPRTVSAVNVAVSGTSALWCYRATPTGYWWDERGNIPGPLLNDALTMLRSLPVEETPNEVLWIQGEADAKRYAGADDVSDDYFRALYQGSVLSIINTLRRACSCSLGIVQRLGPQIDPATNKPSMEAYRGMNLVRNAQYNLLATGSNHLRWGAIPDVFMPLRDEVHPTDIGLAWIGAETARSV